MLGAFFDLGDFEHGCGRSGAGHQRGRWGFEGFMNEFWGPGRGGPRGRGWKARARSRLRAGRPQVRHPAPARREAAPRLRDHQGARGAASAASYAPSPGTVYPTLTMLEDLGYARVVPEEGGKKIYEITDEGRKHLAEHSTTVDDIFERIASSSKGSPTRR